MKKIWLLLVLMLVFGGLVSAQDTRKEAHKNVIYFGNTGILGIALCYERMLLPNLSLLVDAGYAGIFEEQYVSINLRWYPGSGSEGTRTAFYMSLGAGFGEVVSDWNWPSLLKTYEEKEYGLRGPFVSPGIGLKLGSGKPNGFVFSPGIGVDIFVGEKKERISSKIWGEPEFGIIVSPNLKILFGLAF